MKKIALALVGIPMAAMTMGAGALAQTDEPSSVGTETLSLRYQPEDELQVPPIIDELEPETVLTMRAIGFDRDRTGSIRQCRQGSARECWNQLAVRFDDRGVATFQYLITNNSSGASDEGTCRLGVEVCTIELTVGDKTSIIDTVFIDVAPPVGRVDVTPRSDLVMGDTVAVRASGFQPGSALTLMVCAAPSTSGSRCGAPGPVTPLMVGADGTAEIAMTLDVGEVGSDRVACARRVPCRIVVISDQPGARARPVALSFSDFPGVDYTAARVITGLGVGAALILLAGWLIGSTDWDPPREADSSLIDNAEFADLDLEAAQFEERLSAQEPDRGHEGPDRQ